MNSRLFVRIVLCFAFVACLAGSALAQSTQPSAIDGPTRDELLRQINELREKIERLEAKQQEGPSQAVVDETVQRVLADSKQRSELQIVRDVTVTGGFDSEKSRFFLRSEDGNFVLIPGFIFQYRNVTNWQEDGKANGSDDTQNGSEIRRMKFLFEGNAFTPNLLYKFQWESNSEGGGVVLQDAWARYIFAKNWAVQVGQFKDIPFHEESMFDQYQLAAERSLVNALIGGGQTARTQGLMVMYDDKDHWRGQLLIDDGYNTANTNFTDDSGGTAFTGVTPTDFGASGRLEYFAMGERRAYDEFSARNNKEDLLVVGIGASFSQGGSSDVLFHTIDIQYENTKGLGLYGAFLGQWKQIGDDEPVLPGDYYNWGFLVQAGQMLTDKFEIFGRYNLTRLQADTSSASGDQSYQEITVGVNYYIRGQNVRFTLDASYVPDGSPIPQRGLGILGGDGAQFNLRAQFQLLI